MMKGRVYKIISYLDDANEEDVYYGSTKTKIQARYLKHISDYKSWKENKFHYISSFDIFEKYTPECCGIELVEEFDFINDEHLIQREAYYIFNNNCVNKIIPEYKNERIQCECGELYTYKHKSRHLLSQKHNDKINGVVKLKYKDTHQDDITNWKKQSFKCDCGGKYQNASKAEHFRCKKHLDWINK